MSQDGDGNISSILQDEGNSSDVVQSGDENESGVNQLGEGNFAQTSGVTNRSYGDDISVEALTQLGNNNISGVSPVRRSKLV